MTRIAILPETTDTGDVAFRAIAGGRQGVGKTAGEALDAVTALLPPDEVGTLIIVQQHRPDPFFTAEQQARLKELMTRWRAARDAGRSLTPDEQAELESLVDTEVRAAAERAAALIRDRNL